ncbi:hypothetical protein QR680_005719 [Steinernema hermaphroditum]|uniref:Thyroglobulin type-1 domain-containing protein n=1 Tax=Steinernema hermaphroditum TaxID=289476 RepID=A0AA39HT38_9BILA|nr:hypothetical protein QR680_005719 [Steinernema hermaphroditum]
MLLPSLVSIFFLVGSVHSSVLLYYPAHFHQNDLCVKLKCGQKQLCLVKDDGALCVDKDQLSRVHREHARNAGHLSHSHGTKGKHNPKHLATEHKHECGVKALHSMGFRMLEWAGAMYHAQGAVSPVEMPKHRAVCRAEVLWMFTQWDGNNDGELSLRELYPLEADQREKCMKEFLDHCDTEPGTSSAITVDEWCDCYNWAENYEKEPACHAEQHNKDPHELGAFHPRCDVDGFYRPEQCHENECWCVDRYGREFDKSRVQGQLPDCAQYASHLTKAEKESLQSEL